MALGLDNFWLKFNGTFQNHFNFNIKNLQLFSLKKNYISFNAHHLRQNNPTIILCRHQDLLGYSIQGSPVKMMVTWVGYRRA